MNVVWYKRNKTLGDVLLLLEKYPTKLGVDVFLMVVVRS